MTSRKPFRSSHEMVMQTALQALQHSGVKRLPIDLFAMMDTIPNLQRCSYTRLAERTCRPVPEVCAVLGSDYGTYVHDAGKNRHVIYYNDQAEHRGLLRFTLAHELAHFYLSHTREVRDSIPYAVLESEANYFARNLLAPMPLVDRLLPDYEYHSQNLYRLTSCFHLSYHAAKVRLLNCRCDRRVMDNLREFAGFFDDFVLWTPGDTQDTLS